MRIGGPTEIKANENRIAVVPAGVEALVSDGHEVAVQNEHAGSTSSFMVSVSPTANASKNLSTSCTLLSPLMLCLYPLF